MSKKSIVVTKVCEGHDNPISELVKVACKFDSEITLESDNRKSMQKASWVLWHLILQMECLLILLQRVMMSRKL